MNSEVSEIARTGIAALLFAGTFLFGGHVYVLRLLGSGRRTIISFSAGLASAYVFVHVMPELHGAREALVESASVPLKFEGMGIYLVALTGFLVFYGLEHLRKHLRKAGGEGAETIEGTEGAEFGLHIGGFAAYVFLMSYLLVHNLEETTTSLALYAVAIVFHFLAVAHELQNEHGAAYTRLGRWVLAAAAILGWTVGQMVALPFSVLALLVAFLSGAIMMNSLISELPSEKEGQFLPFMAGGLMYGLILLPLG
jgi:hypothetical protein